MNLVLLGTKGGPKPSLHRSGFAQAIVVDNRAFLVDCGEGVVHQLLKAEIAVESLEAIFITHHHSDHNVSYANVIMSGWANGRSDRLDTYGPPPIAQKTRAAFDQHAYDIDIRIADERRVDIRPLVLPHEISSGGVVLDDGVRVTAAVVDHPPVEPALAYRFDANGRSIVISGDTAPCDALVELAAGADVLVHEVVNLELVKKRHPAGNADPAALLAHHKRSHTPVEEVGTIAAKAGVGTLVLSHFVPEPAGSDDSMWVDPARADFDGQIVMGADLTEIGLDAAGVTNIRTPAHH